MTATSANIADLWAGFDEHPDDLGRLLVIADAYRDEGMDTWADCLQWCYRNQRKPDGPLRDDEVYEFPFEWYVIQGWETMADNEAYIPFCFESVCERIHEEEYRDGHPTPSLAYQFLCRMWDEIGGVKEDV